MNVTQDVFCVCLKVTQNVFFCVCVLGNVSEDQFEVIYTSNISHMGNRLSFICVAYDMSMIPSNFSWSEERNTRRLVLLLKMLSCCSSCLQVLYEFMIYLHTNQLDHDIWPYVCSDSHGLV